MIKIEASEMQQAYRALKSDVYWDKSNTNLLLRKRIAEFENRPGFGTDDFFDKVINKNDVETKINEITLLITPKRLKDETSSDDVNCIEHSNYIDNSIKKDEYEVERLNIFIDCPVELHILNILWIFHFGYALDQKLSVNCYGNRLNFKKNKKINREMLFKPYYSQYQSWRDESIKSAQYILDEQEKNAAILTMDIKDYYYSIAMDKEQLESDLNIKDKGTELTAEKKFIWEIFLKMHKKYTKLLSTLKYPKDNNISGLQEKYFSIPIGLRSSPILANWYLKEFDKIVEEKLTPFYYGRYVDDMIFVFNNPGIFDAPFCCHFEDCLEKRYIKEGLIKHDTVPNRKKVCLSKTDIFTINHLHECIDVPVEDKLSEEKKECTEFSRKSKYKKTLKTVGAYVIKQNPRNHKNVEEILPKLRVQHDKVYLYYFDRKMPRSVLEKLKKDIEIASSEFRFSLEDYPATFEDKTYELVFDGNSRKIITLKDYKVNDFGVSVFLAKKLNRLVYVNEGKDKDFQAIKRFFQGQNIIDYSKHWERLLTYYVFLGKKEEIFGFVETALKEINKLNYDEYQVELERLTKVNKVENLLKEKEYQNDALKWKLYYSFVLAVALNPELILQVFENIEKQSYETIKEMLVVIENEFPKLSKTIKKDIKTIRKSNMIRHNFLGVPLYNYTKLYQKNTYSNLINSKNKNFDELVEEYDFYPLSFEYSPRKISNYEFFIAQFLHRKPDSLFDKLPACKKKIPLPRIEISQYYDSGCFVQKIDCSEYYEKKEKLSIAIANFHVLEQDVKNKLNGEHKITLKRYEAIHKVLDAAEKESVDIVVLPEWSVPLEMLSDLCRYSMQKERAIVFGMDYLVLKETVYNNCGVILPICSKDKEYKDAIFIPRLKNHYSPKEIEMITGLGKKTPHNNEASTEKSYQIREKFNHFSANNRYDIFDFKGCKFSVFYCFEFSDIVHRSIMKGNVDLLFVPEYNKDVSYFSNLVESLSRDIHCYIAQCNSAQYGDTRIVQPAKKEYNRDIVKIKGGENNTILIGEIDIKRLREFHQLAYNAQLKENAYFKPLPPNFKR